METTTSLANHFLIAMPSLTDPNFAKTVIYLCEHRDEGAVGLIVNRPMQFSLSLVFEQLDVDSSHSDQSEMPLLFGGPIQPERGFVLHKNLGEWRTSLFLQDEVTVTTSNDIIRALAQGTGPKDVLVTLGYSAWFDNQLEKEIAQNTWLVCPFHAEILYDVPFNQRWEYAGLTLGVNMNQLSVNVGHA